MAKPDQPTPAAFSGNHRDPLAPKAYVAGAASIPALDLRPVPFEDKLIIRQDLAATKIGSLIIPDMSMVPPLMGTVISVGAGIVDRASGIRIPMDVIVGDRVTFPQYAGEDVLILREKCKVLRQGDLHFRFPRVGESGFEEVELAANTPLEASKLPGQKKSPIISAN